MNRLSGGAIALLFLASPLPALSQGMDGLGFSGGLEFEYTQHDDSARILAGGDIFLRYSGGFGFELGADVDEDLEGGDDASLPYLALTMGTAFGEVALGAPQPVADMLITVPEFAGMRVLQRDFDRLGVSVATGVAKDAEEKLYGARLVADAGGLRWGASIHGITHQSGAHWQAAAEYSLGSGTQIEGAVQGEDGNLGVTIGAVHEAGQFDMGLYLSSQRIVGASDSATAFLGYAVSGSLTVRGHLRAEDGDTTGNMVGVEAEYGFSDNAYAQFGAADGNNTSMTVDASVGFKF